MASSVDGDIKLNVGLNTSNVKQESNKLAKTIQSIFSGASKDSKTASSNIKSLQNQIEKAQGDLEKAKQKQQEIAKTPVKSDAYKSLEKDLVKYNTQLDTTKAKITSVKSELLKIQGVTVPSKQFEDYNASLQNAEKELGRLEKRLNDYRATQEKMKVDESVYTNSTQWQRLNAQVEIANENVKIWEDKIATLKAQGKDVSFIPRTQTDEYKKTASELNDLIQKRRQLETQINQANQAMQQPGMITQGIDTQAYDDASRNVNNLENRLELLKQKEAEAQQKAQEAGNTIKESFGSKVKNAFSKAGNALKSFGKTVTGIKDKLKELKNHSTGTFGDMAKSAKRSFWNIMRYAFGIRSLFIIFKRLRKYIGEAFGAMHDSVPQVRAEIDALKVSFTQVRNSLATAFQPIFSAVVPALMALSNALITAMNALANFFATLTGQKFIYKATKANDALADSIGGAGAAAKEANEDIAEYDKLIVINKDNAGGGGGGGGAANANAGAFEKVPAEMSNLAKLIKDAWKKSDFTQVGKYIGNQLSGALDKIPWNKIKRKAQNIGKDLATLINGFVAVPDLGTKIGKTISEAFNTGFEAVYSFVHNLNWKDVGKFIGDAITGALLNFDWDLASKTLTEGIGGIADTVNSAFEVIKEKLPTILGKINKSIKDFIDNFPVDKLSTSIAGLINIITTTVNELLPNIADLVGKATELISKTIKKIDWKKVGELFSTALKTIIDSVTKFFENLDVEAVGKAIGDFLSGIDWAGLAQSLWKLLKQLFKTAIDLLIKGIPALFKSAPIESTIIAAFAIFKFTGLGSSIASKIGTSLVTALGSGTLGSTIASGIGNLFKWGGAIAATVGAAIAGWKIGNLIYDSLPKDETGDNAIDNAVDTILGGDPRDKAKAYQANEDRKQQLASINKSISQMKVEIKRAGLTGEAANKALKESYEKVKKQIDEIYGPIKKNSDGTMSWTNNLKDTGKKYKQLDAQVRLGLISEEEARKEIGKVISENSKLTKTFGKNTKSAFSTATSKLRNLTRGLKNNNKELNETTKQTGETTIKNTKTVTDGITKNFKTMQDGIVKSGAQASAKTVANIKSINTKTKGVASTIKNNFNNEFGNIKDPNIDFEAIKTNAKTGTSGLAKLFTDEFDKIKSPNVKFDNIKTNASSVLDGENGLTKIFSKAFEAIKAPSVDFSGLKTNANNILNGKDGLTNLFKTSFEAIKGSANTNLNGDNGIKKMFNTAFNYIKTKSNSMGDNGKANILKIWNNAKKLIADNKGGIFAHFKKAYDNIKTQSNGMGNNGKANIVKIWNASKKYIADGTTGISKHFSGAFSSITNGAGSLVTAINKAFAGITTPNFSSAQTSGTNAGNAIKNSFSGAYNQLSSVSTVLSAIANKLNALSGFKINISASATVNKAGGGSQTVPAAGPTPRLASGAVIPPNREFLAVLGDQKQGYNIETPLDTMVQAFKMALNDGGTGTSSNKEPIVLQLDGKTVASVVWDENKKRYKQTGNAKFA